MRRYAVVLFKKTGVVNEVPDIWIVRDPGTGEYSCWWPKNALRTRYLIQQPEIAMPNDEEFFLYEIDTPMYFGKDFTILFLHKKFKQIFKFFLFFLN